MRELIRVEGMSCSACSAAVERQVLKLEGVHSAEVSLMQKLLVCEYDENKLTRNEIFEAVKKVGFSAFTYNPKENISKNENERKSKSNVRLILSVILLLVLMYISMGHMMGAPLPAIISPHTNPFLFGLVQLIITIPIVILNRKFFVVGTKAFFSKAPNMDSLVCVGSGAALIFGVYNLVMMVVNSTKSQMLANNLYFESAATILTLVSVGKYLEERSKVKAGKALDGLLNLAEQTAIVLSDGMETQINAADIKVGDILVIKPGNRLPCDGIIVKGHSSFDQKALTGESMPVEKSEGDSVMSACVNLDGYLLVRATKVGEQTTLVKIISLVKQAGASKAPIARLADKISGFFVPCVMIIGIVTFIVWLCLGYDLDFALSRAISVLVISCPCALGLATPVAITVAAERCAKEGILVKSAKSLEALNAVDTVVFDKTGTITKGHPSLTDIIPFGCDRETLLFFAYSVEKNSEHPLSYAVCSYVEDNYKQCADIKEVDNFKAIFGKGVYAETDGKVALGGNYALMEQYNIDISEVKDKCKELSKQGKTPLIFALDGSVMGIIAASDTLKDNAAQQIQRISKMGIEVYMLTGDNELCANAVARDAGINEKNVFSQVLPQEKQQKIEYLQSLGKNVLMVGDGINDSPSMVKANVSMAIGSGADIAVDCADIVLMKSNLADVCTAIGFARKTVKNIKENLFWAFFYNVLGIPVAAGLFFFAFGIVLNPMIAAAAMSFSSLFVVFNALRILKIKA